MQVDGSADHCQNKWFAARGTALRLRKIGGAGLVRAPKTRCLSRRPRLGDLLGGIMPLRMRVHDREPIGAALRRFKKLLERSGLTKELRKRKFYEKPCEARRRAKLRKLSAIRKGKMRAAGKSYR